MEDEGKTKGQRVVDSANPAELAAMRRRIAELEAAETEHKRVKEALRELEERWSALAENAPNIIVIVDRDSRTQFVNRTVRVASVEEVIGRSVYDYARPEYHAVVRKTIERVFETGESGEYEILVGPDDCASWYLTQVGAIKRGGRVVAATLIATDITEHKRAVEELQQYTTRLRALGAQLAEVAEAERQRLARELHDRVGQKLTALGINLSVVRSQMPEGTAALVRSRLDDSLALVGQTAGRIRDVMADLRPLELDDYGLMAALHWCGERFARRTGIAVAVKGEKLVPRAPTRVENALFRIAQEALTNATKHAQATRVMVAVEVDGGTLRLVVADDGLGFDPAHLTGSGGGRGWGLLLMSERAEAVGGHCRIESAPGQGTQVIVEVDR